MSEEVLGGSNCKIFVSYSRVDRSRVQPIVDALRAMTYEVWWDTQLSGGASFTAQTEAELEGADIVLVIWTKASVESNWVKDEAASGRERGRLLPVILDDVKPPLGFRQLQWVDLRRWNRRADAPEIQELVKDIGRVANLPVVKPPPAPPSRKHLPRYWPIIAALVLLAVVLVVGARYAMPALDTTPRTIAVLPFADLGETKNGAFADGLAEEILDALARDPKLKVLGRTSAWSLRDHADDMGLIRDKLKVGRILEGSVRQVGERIKVSVRLVDTADGEELWVQSFDRRITDSFALQEEIAGSVARRMGRTVNTVQQRVMRSAVPGVYEKLLIAKQLLRARQVDSLKAARVLLAETVEADPENALAYALQSMSSSLSNNQQYGSMTPAAAGAEAERQAKRALALDPNLPEALFALGVVEADRGNSDAAIDLLKRAVSLNPASAEFGLRLGRTLRDAGRPREAIAALGRAFEQDPLWPTLVFNMIDAYGAAGQPKAALELAARFASLSPEPALVNVIDAAARLRSGDAAGSLALVNQALAGNPKMSTASQQRVVTLLALDAADRIGPADFVSHGEAGRAFIAARYGEAADAFLKQGPSIWYAPAAAELLTIALVMSERHLDLVRSIEAHFGSAGGYAGSPSARPLTAVFAAHAFERAGRSEDAKILRAFARIALQRSEQGGTAPAENATTWAFLLAEEGDSAGAIAKLQTAMADGWWTVCIGPTRLFNALTPTGIARGMLAPTGLGRDVRLQPLVATCRLRLNEQRRLAGIPPLS